MNQPQQHGCAHSLLFFTNLISQFKMICMKQPAKKNRMSEMCLRCRLAPWWTSPVTNWFVDQFSVNQQKASIHSTDWEPSGTIFVFRCLDPRMQRQWQEAGRDWGGMSGNGGFWLGDKLRRVQWRPPRSTRASSRKHEEKSRTWAVDHVELKWSPVWAHRESWLGNEPQVCLTVGQSGHAHDTKWTEG